MPNTNTDAAAMQSNVSIISFRFMLLQFIKHTQYL